MIIYLGMPRSASSWLYNQLGGIEPKETHHLYTNPINLEEYCQDKIFDFSTNNWSMDSQVARAIDSYVSHYILILRNPIDFAVSYKAVLNNTQSLDEFVSVMIVNKLLCYGDIVERWFRLTDPKKMLIYTYENISANNHKFVNDITKRLNVPVPVSISINKTNAVLHKSYQKISEKNLMRLQNQIDKFEKITNLPLNYTINT